MNCYALIRLLESFETMTSQANLMDLNLAGKGKKSRTKPALGFNWEEERQPILQLLTQLLELDIRHLWNHSVIEEEFVSLVTGCCYRLLENPTISHQKNRPMQEAITRLLGVALTRYNHVLSATVKIIQMLQHFEHLASVLVAAVSLWATDYGMKSIVGEIVREIGQKCPQELSRDPAGTKGFAAFLTELAERVPAVLMSSMCILVDHLDGENHMMRNAVLAAMAEMVLQVLNGDQLEEAARDTRDQFLDTLQAHGHDVNSFVRSRVLQLFTRIVQQKALPLTRFQAVVALAVGRLADKSVLVCKNAIQLLASFLANNPFSCKLSDTDLAGPLQKEMQKLQEMRAQRRAAAATAVLDSEEEWEAMIPELKSTLQQLLKLPQEEEIPEQIANSETAEEVKERIRQLLAKASYRQAIVLTREATGHFQESEPFRHTDPGESGETRFLNLLGIIFKGPTASAQEKTPQQSAGNAVPGQIVCKNKPSASEPEGTRGNEDLMKQEMLVQYLQDAHSFSQKITEAISIIGKMMYENTTTVVQEVIEFFVMVFHFGVPQALFGVRRMLPLIWAKEPGVREAVLNAYRQLYLSPKGDSARAKAQALIHNLSLLLVDASVGTIQCLEEILCEFVQKDELKPAVTQLLWERATEKAPCSPLERCCSVTLLGMLARGKPEIVGSNLDTLVSIGLDEKFPQDYRLAQQVCHAIASISDRRKPSLGKRHPAFRLPQEHRLFERLREIVTKGFVHPDPLWIPFKEVAVTLIYQLAEGPEVICAQILQGCAKQALEKLGEKSATQEDPQETPPALPTFLLMHLLSLAGDVALHQLVHLEQAVSGELCRRRAVREEEEHKARDPKEKNTSSETTMEEELGLVGATADDTEAELIRGICEMELLDGKQTLAAFVPLLLKVCNNPGLYSNPDLCAAAALALGKFCMISATFCDSQLRLLFTMLEKSPIPVVRSNLMVAAGDLAIRFPNLVDPWTPHLYARLRDPAQHVRRTAGLVMTHLILKDMVKVKGQVSEMAVLLIDPEPQIAALAKNFFNELSHKGNAIYNLLPDIISRLSDPQGGVEEGPFHTIMKQLLSYITKDKQTESLVEKLCQRFRTARTERQHRDLAYCVSQLPLTERCLRRALDNFSCFGDKLSDATVFSAFLSVVGKLRRGAKPEGKAVIDEFEQKLRACHTRGLDGIEGLEIGQGASQRTPSAEKQRAVSRRQPPASAALNDFATPEPRCATSRHPNSRRRVSTKKPKIVFSSDESSDEELSAEMTEDETPKKTTPIRRASTRRPRS
ncbi:condensin complex subunit 1 [Carlito syrichta]|uniref:Condensin complex subunit 1 n=1 Tax=Carlito syrichta TaxID=1868482 RepID=A0A1U7U7Y2_CARSF|nr:condensin complex subunit 1 [Carlito syrichta]